MSDSEMMRRAIELADAARASTSPEPWTGAVLLTADGHLFEGSSGPDGTHAEVAALTAAAKVGVDARRATMACTLEPCAHREEGLACADLLVAAGLGRLVVGLEDPDPKQAGRGLARLRDAGVEVRLGVMEGAVSEQLAPYLHHRRTGRPWVVLVAAATLDGRVAAPGGPDELLGPAALADLDRRWGATSELDEPLASELESEAEPRAALEALGRRGVLQLVVGGGTSTTTALHDAGLVDRYVLYVAASVLGRHDATPILPAATSAPAGLWRGRVLSIERLGDDLRIELEPACDAGRAAR
jgi:diaminohydroxyphosphoribosylaminopyrimidine deaminase/5-amino-6-(5-phosphoribosylamino)uracil reductase